MEYSFISIWNCIMGTISAVGMVSITFYVYKHTSKSSKIESYFTHLVELYNKIEEDLQMLNDTEKDQSSTDALNIQQEQCARRIKVNSTVMIYYLLRIPGFYKGRLEFIGILDGISRNPYKFSEYSLLSERFKEFCWELRDKKKVNYSIPFNYDGKPIKK